MTRRYYLESHILEASPFFAGEYMSANKKSVELRTGAISTKRGYPEKRTVRVVGEEAFYASEPEPFRVLFVDAPLEGPALAVEAPIELPASRRADDISAFLLQTAENKLVLNKLQREIDEFNQTYILVAGFEDAAVERVRAIWCVSFFSFLFLLLLVEIYSCECLLFFFFVFSKKKKKNKNKNKRNKTKQTKTKQKTKETKQKLSFAGLTVVSLFACHLSDRTLEQLVCANPDLRKLYNGSDRQLAALSSVVDSYWCETITHCSFLLVSIVW